MFQAQAHWKTSKSAISPGVGDSGLTIHGIERHEPAEGWVARVMKRLLYLAMKQA